MSSFLRSIGAAMLRRPEPVSDARKVLNVGGNTKAIPIPKHYDGWDHLLLDIDPTGKPDVVCDARELVTLAPAAFDAVYCSHNLEHYYAHDVRKVLAGFLHVLKDEGFAEIRVPDLKSVMERCVRDNVDVGDVLYQSPAGPITVRDVFYGFGVQIERTGVDFFAHKTGFTPKARAATMNGAGFGEVFILERPDIYEVAALAFKTHPTEWHRSALNI
jgi:hypothetical protein